MLVKNLFMAITQIMFYFIAWAGSGSKSRGRAGKSNVLLYNKPTGLISVFISLKGRDV